MGKLPGTLGKSGEIFGSPGISRSSGKFESTNRPLAARQNCLRINGKKKVKTPKFAAGRVPLIRGSPSLWVANPQSEFCFPPPSGCEDHSFQNHYMHESMILE